MEERIIQKVDEKIENILNEDININNLDNLYKLTKIKHMAKEDKNMNYGNYGASSYGRDNYGRRGYDMKYCGDEHLDRMAGEYGRYMESRSRYGASEETDKSFHYMVKALEDFVQVLHQEADTPQQKQMLNETLQRSIR